MWLGWHLEVLAVSIKCIVPLDGSTQAVITPLGAGMLPRVIIPNTMTIATARVNTKIFWNRFMAATVNFRIRPPCRTLAANLFLPDSTKHDDESTGSSKLRSTLQQVY